MESKNRVSFFYAVLTLLVSVSLLIQVSPVLAWDEWPEASTDDKNHSWTVVFKQTMDTSTINSQNIYVSTDSSGNSRVSGVGVVALDDTHALISPPAGGWKVGTKYYLIVTQKVLTDESQPLKDAVRMVFNVDPNAASSAFGNSPNNLINDGSICQNGNWNYYANPADRNRLYRVHIDGSGKQKLADEDWVYYINVSNDWIYYIAQYNYYSDSDNFGGLLCRMHTDGSNKQLLLSKDFVTWICLYKNKLYFNSINGGLGCMNVDGSGVISLNKGEQIGRIYIVDDWIYCSMYRRHKLGSGNELFKIRTDGSDRTTISRQFPAYTFIVADDYIYYVNDKDNYLYNMRTDGSGISLVSNQGYFNAINVKGSWLYVYDSKKVDQILRVKIGGTGLEKIVKYDDFNIAPELGINIINDWIYFRIITEWKPTSDQYYASFEHLYRIHLDGSGMELVAEGPRIRNQY
ncbi:MAG: DUF5050 domain-containing protein [Syntrophomonas sp.]